MQSRAAIRYAKAIYDIANEENSVNEVYRDMNFINELDSSSLDFKNLLSNSHDVAPNHDFHHSRSADSEVET